MAEMAVSSIAKSLLQQLSSPAKDELILWWNSKAELERLKNTITTIKDVLHDAEQRQENDAAVQGWLLRLREMLYKGDDLFDIISTRALRKRIPGNKVIKSARLFFSRSNHVVFTITTAHKVKDLRQRLDDIANDMNRFQFILSRPVEDERPAMKARGQTHSYVPKDYVIGREKEKAEIISMLLADTDGQERVSVIAVIGIGGLGKSTLAQHVYCAKEVEDHFDLLLWACVNYLSDLKGALEKIISCGTDGTPSGGLQLDQLQNMLRRKISGRKFFLVLDDVWEEGRERWLALKVLLDAGERGSRILVTTRLKEVAENLATVTPCYALGELSDEHAWLLFKRVAFDSNLQGELQNKEELGRKIVKKCSNVPLALRTIGSFLLRKDKREWSKFVDNELVKLIPDRQNMIMQVLKISYNDLPTALKRCFAYCSLIPKGIPIHRFVIIQLWMAQGLLETSSENPCPENVGENYLDCLIDRCFIQDANEKLEGYIPFYKMHDLFNDLAVEVAGKEFLRAPKIPDDIQERSPRHVRVSEIKDSLFEVKGMRSLILTDLGYVERSQLDALFLHLTSLRALALIRLDMKEIPSSIGRLVHLRFLDLSWSEELIRLPSALCKLQNLLTLNCHCCSRLKELPDDLQKLISLRHLIIEECEELNHMPSGLKELTSLVRLDRLVVNKDHATLGCLKHLNNLTGSLEIRLPRGQWENCVEDAEESMLRDKGKLSRLSVSWDASTEGEEMSETNADAVLDGLQPANTIEHLDVLNFPGRKFPEWFCSLDNLVALGLVNCSKCVELPCMRKLFQLKRLKLKSIPLLEYLEEGIYNDGGSLFSSLETVVLEDMPSLKGWWKLASGKRAHQLTFTKLSDLSITRCPELTQLPLCPFLKCLVVGNINANLLNELVAGVSKSAVEVESNRHLVVSSPSAHPACQHLSTIRGLWIENIPNLDRHYVLRALPHLTGLEELGFRGYSVAESSVVDINDTEETWKSLARLKLLAFQFGSDAQGARLLKGLHHLTSLRVLHIYGNLPVPADDMDDSQWMAPPNLKTLGVNRMNQAAPLSSLIKQLNKLDSLVFTDCYMGEDELDKIEWENVNLTYLAFCEMPLMTCLPPKCQRGVFTDLRFIDCAEMENLPDWLSCLASFHIKGCPKLKEKCRKPNGLYWSMLQDINNIDLF